jgi:hypothetical protein
VADFFTFNFYELQFPQYLSAEATLPDGFSVAAVPELSTWAMLLIGFAVIGGCGIIHCANLTRLIREFRLDLVANSAETIQDSRYHKMSFARQNC